jgi:hypothetical protein
MNTTFDIVMRENDFVLYQNNQPLLTPNGNETAHANARLLRMVISSEITGQKQGLQPVELLQNMTDTLKSSASPLPTDLSQLIVGDPLLEKECAIQPDILGELLNHNHGLFDFIYLNSSSLAFAVNTFLNRKQYGTDHGAYLAEVIGGLSAEQKVLLGALHAQHGMGLLVHLLLILGFLSVSEYAAAVMVLEISCDTQKGSPYSADNYIVDHFSFLVHNALMATDFLTLCNEANKLSVIEEIIHRGEDGQTEFKSTLRWDLRQAKKSPDIEHASLKTICAFLNSEGGDLLIGVRDDGSIEGIETDQFDNDDRFLLHLWMLIKTTMGHEVIEWVKTSIQKFGNKTVCRVNCRKASKPVFLNHKNIESFYVRVGPASNSLEIRAALKYIEEHF